MNVEHEQESNGKHYKHFKLKMYTIEDIHNSWLCISSISKYFTKRLQSAWPTKQSIVFLTKRFGFAVDVDVAPGSTHHFLRLGFPK